MTVEEAIAGTLTRLEAPGGFYLDRVGRQDKAAYLEHMNDPEIARNLLLPPFPYTESDADWWIARCEEVRRNPEIHFAIRDPRGTLVGSIGATVEWTSNAHRAEIGYWLARAYRGQGVMPAVLRVFSAYAITTLGFHRLIAHPFAFNAASQRALEKAGFQREGRLREHYRKSGVFLDAFVYGLLAQEIESGAVPANHQARGH